MEFFQSFTDFLCVTRACALSAISITTPTSTSASTATSSSIPPLQYIFFIPVLFSSSISPSVIVTLSTSVSVSASFFLSLSIPPVRHNYTGCLADSRWRKHNLLKKTDCHFFYSARRGSFTLIFFF